MTNSFARHLEQYKSPRASTLRQKAKSDQIHAILAREVLKLRRKERIARIKRALWPSWVWR